MSGKNCSFMVLKVRVRIHVGPASGRETQQKMSTFLINEEKD